MGSKERYQECFNARPGTYYYTSGWLECAKRRGATGPIWGGALLPAAGLWASSAIFALLHVGPKLRFLPWTLSSWVAGMVFGQLFLWTGDLGGPVVAHFTVNALNLRYLSSTDLR